MDYLDFELEIDIGSGGEYPVAVIRSPAGEAHETMHLPFDEQALDNQLSTLQNILLNSGETDAQNLATGEQTIQRFGQTLFEALFTGQVRDLYVASRTAAESQDKGLRVKLRLQAAELAALPWEFLYDAGQSQYLCLSDKTPLVRYVELPTPCQPLTVMPPLSILGMTASPQDLPELDEAREQQRITTALAPLQARGLAQVTWLQGHTWQDLQQALLAGPWHIFHFIGHGGFDTNTHQGVIMLEDKAGQSHSLSASQLGMLLADHQTLRLVVLSSCQGAKGSTRASFSSTALQVVRHGIPAVLAHQYDISDEAAITLSRTFYAALAAGMPVDTAVSEARKAISLGGGQSLEWGTPVLHLHAPDGVLFHLTPPDDLAASTQQAVLGSTGPTAAGTAVISSAQASPLAIQEPLAASVVRIRTTQGRVEGAGFLVGARQILTCAHVISQALGLDEAAVDLPQAAVSLDFPFVSPRTLFTAKVVVWCPALADGSGDIAGLELQGEPPAGVEAVRFAPSEDVWEHAFRAFGFPEGYDDGVWATGRLLGRQATGWVMIEDVKTQGFAVAPGFSGTPVWDTWLEGVVGMVVAASRPAETKAAFVIPLKMLVAAWPLIEPITRQRIFLSAAPADSAFADRLRADLEARDIVVWTEQQTPENDQSPKEERIRQAIRAAQAVVLVVSSQTRSSRTVKEHLRLADVYQRRLILVWVGDDEHAQPQHYGWRTTTWVDAHSTPYKAALDAIEANLSQQRSISALLGPSHAIPEEEQKEPRNPYKGLRAFTANDAGDFFGRDRLVDEVVKDVEKLLLAEQAATKSERLLTILGPSGSGKSSVVMAGLLPRLQHGALPGSDTWIYLESIVPGKRPIEALGLTLKPHFPDTSFKTLREDLEDDATRGLHLLATQLVKQRGSKVVLLVDQFEELFTQTESEDERQRFIDLVLTATTEPRGQLLVLLTLRADFYDRLLQYPELYQLIKVHQKPLLPMEVEDLRATIEQPAALPDVQLTFEGDLVGDLLFEMQGQVGVLPLLQFTLDQLFQKRSGHRLTLQAYREIGGVKGALAQHAEQTYAALPSEEHRKLARALFVRLIDPGATEQDTTRRRAALSEFTLADAAQTRLLRETIDTFIAARLLTTNEVAGTTTIEVSHEAVIREWKRLADWMREARQDIPLQQAISEDATEWERHGKPGDRLYRGSQLKEAQAWARRNMPSGNEVAFLRAGLRANSAQRIRYVVSVTVIVLLLLSTTGLVGWLLTRNPNYVNTLNDNGLGSLRYAVDVANPGSTITFDASLHGTIVLSSGNLDITKNLKILGPGAGILSISGGTNNAHFHVSKGATLDISGLSFKNSETVVDAFLYNEGTLTVTNSVIEDNKTTGSVNNQGVVISQAVGGGILNRGILDVTNTIILGNTVTIGAGGGIANFGKLTLNHSTVSDNMATGGGIGGTSHGTGGGITNSGTLTLNNNSIVSGNMATYSSGGISNDSGATLTLNNSTISDNTAQYDSGIGSVGTITLNNSTISDNTASRNSGGITNYYGAVLTLNNSTISGNIASSGYGGGVSNLYGGTLTLNNSTISGNTAGSSGGGIFILGNGQPSIKQTDLTFSTIYGNTAHDGGDIAIEDSDSNGTPIKQLSQVKISNSIVAGDPAHPGPDIIGMLTSHGYNLFQDNSGASFDPATRAQHGKDKPLSVNDLTRLFADPVGLRENGGPTMTYALGPDSPALDQIPRQYCQVQGIWNKQSRIYTDQRGKRRPGPGKDRCDIGAYESAGLPG